MRLSDRVYAARKYGYTGRDNSDEQVLKLMGFVVAERGVECERCIKRSKADDDYWPRHMRRM